MLIRTLPLALVVCVLANTSHAARRHHSGTVFEGDLAGENVRVILHRIDEHTDEIFGVSIGRDGRDSDIRVLSGRGSLAHGRFELDEYTIDKARTGRVIATDWSLGKLRGQWTTADGETLDFELRYRANDFEDDPAFAIPEGRLFQALRDERWQDAIFYNYFRCARDPCTLATSLRLLAAGKPLDPSVVNPSEIRLLQAFELEREGDRNATIRGLKSLCEPGNSFSDLACQAYFSYLPVMSPGAAREAHRIGCKRGNGCEDYLGVEQVHLIEAAGKGDLERVRELLAVCADPNVYERPLPPALTAAASAGSLPIVRLLLDAGSDPNLDPDPWQPTPLNIAIRLGASEMATLLLDRGAKVDKDTFLAAIEPANSWLLDRLLASGLDPDGTNDGWYDSPLIATVRAGDVDIARKLLQHGADPHWEGKFTGGSAIDIARESGQQAMLDLLLASRKPVVAAAPAVPSPLPAFFDEVTCGMTVSEARAAAAAKGLALEASGTDVMEARYREGNVRLDVRGGEVNGKSMFGVGASDSVVMCADP